MPIPASGFVSLPALDLGPKPTINTFSEHYFIDRYSHGQPLRHNLTNTIPVGAYDKVNNSEIQSACPPLPSRPPHSSSFNYVNFANKSMTSFSAVRTGLRYVPFVTTILRAWAGFQSAAAIPGCNRQLYKPALEMP